MQTHILVTGASRGIGHALCLSLARDGHRVLATARNVETLRALKQEAPDRIEVAALDVANTEPAVKTIRLLDRQYGIGTVIANAGAGLNRSAASPHSWEAVSEACHTNFCGAVATLTAILPQMIARGAGHLVAIGSFSSFAPLPMAAAYSSPKAGLAMFLECLRLDLQDTGVHVTNVHLGFVRTNMVKDATHPMPQMQEVGIAASYLAKHLANKPETIEFPQPLGLLARAGAYLPSALRKRIARQVMSQQK
jgi:short-subunit dehydrogenase